MYYQISGANTLKFLCNKCQWLPIYSLLKINHHFLKFNEHSYILYQPRYDNKIICEDLHCVIVIITFFMTIHFVLGHEIQAESWRYFVRDGSWSQRKPCMILSQTKILL